MKVLGWIIIIVIVVSCVRNIPQPPSQEFQTFLDQYNALAQRSNAHGQEMIEIMSSAKGPEDKERVEKELINLFDRMSSTYKEMLALDSDAPETLTVRARIMRIMPACIDALKAMKQELIDQDQEAFMVAAEVYDTDCGQAMKTIND